MDQDVMIAMKELSKIKSAKSTKRNPKMEQSGMPFKLLNNAEVCEMLSMSRASIYRVLTPGTTSYDPTFPQPVRFGGNCVRWKQDELVEWLNNLERGVGDQPVWLDKSLDNTK